MFLENSINPNKKIGLDNLNGLKPVACIIVNSLSFLSLLVTNIAAANAASGAIIGIIGGIVKIENSKKAVVHETADLWFHTLVMLSHLNLGPNEVLEELKKRFNISGLDEKASRKS